jgi:hypothetical protein
MLLLVAVSLKTKTQKKAANLAAFFIANLYHQYRNSGLIILPHHQLDQPHLNS